MLILKSLVMIKNSPTKLLLMIFFLLYKYVTKRNMYYK